MRTLVWKNHLFAITQASCNLAARTLVMYKLDIMNFIAQPRRNFKDEHSHSLVRNLSHLSQAERSRHNPLPKPHYRDRYSRQLPMSSSSLQLNPVWTKFWQVYGFRNFPFLLYLGSVCMLYYHLTRGVEFWEREEVIWNSKPSSTIFHNYKGTHSRFVLKFWSNSFNFCQIIPQNCPKILFTSRQPCVFLRLL